MSAEHSQNRAVAPARKPAYSPNFSPAIFWRVITPVFVAWVALTACGGGEVPIATRDLATRDPRVAPPNTYEEATPDVVQAVQTEVAGRLFDLGPTARIVRESIADTATALAPGGLCLPQGEGRDLHDGDMVIDPVTRDVWIVRSMQSGDIHMPNISRAVPDDGSGLQPKQNSPLCFVQVDGKTLRVYGETP